MEVKLAIYPPEIYGGFFAKGWILVYKQDIVHWIGLTKFFPTIMVRLDNIIQ